ncbi:MAG: hypothetical protein ACT4QG_01455 [Sporichthyaceae bacterium]
MVVKFRASRLRRGARPAALVLAVGAVFGLTTGLPSGPAEALSAAPVAASYPPPKPCPGCTEFVIDLPAEPTTTTWGTEANLTAEALVTFPTGWSGLTCGDQYGVVARVADEDTGGLPVLGWRCTSSLNSLRFVGPRGTSIEDSGQRLLFRALSPGPVVGIGAGFVEVVQTFQDGERQRRRGIKQMQAGRPADNANSVTVDLPPDWTGACADPLEVGAGFPALPVDGWSCSETPGTGDHPRFRLRWEGTTPARLFYFDAITKVDPPVLTPLGMFGPTQLRDMMFLDGEIGTELVAYLKRGTIPGPTPGPTATASPTPTPRIACNPNGGQIDTGNNGANNFNNGFNNQLTVTGAQGNSQTFTNGVPNNGLINANPGYGPGDPCAPPVVVLDPCSGEIFTKEGPSRFDSEDRVLPPGCAYPGSGTGPMPKPEPVPVAVHHGQACIPRPALAAPGDRASRAHHRAPLRPGVEPTPPIVMVSPEDGSSVQRPPGSNDDRVLVAPPNANPEPSVRALLPEVQDPGVVPLPSVLENPQVPYCDDVALPDTGGRGMGTVGQLALMALGVGGALTAGALYWRRNTPRGLRYTRS